RCQQMNLECGWLASQIRTCTWICPPLSQIPFDPPTDDSSVDPSGKCHAMCSTTNNLAKQSCIDRLKADSPYCFAPSFQTACESYFQLVDGNGDQVWSTYLYGHPNELDHNLLRVFNGEGVLIVENIYDTEPRSPNFNKVIQQHWGAGW